MRRSVFSGEILPTPPGPSLEPGEVLAWNRKLYDYLRRLSAKLDRFVDAGPSIEIFSAYLSADHTLNDGELPIEWTTVLRQDTPYALQAGNDEIRLLQDGFYLICVDALVGPSAAFDVELSTWIYTNGSPSHRVNYGDGVLGQDGSISLQIPLPIQKDLGVGIHAKAASGSGDNILATGTRITILRLFDDFSGGTSKTPGTGWNPSTPGGGVGTSDTPDSPTP